MDKKNLLLRYIPEEQFADISDFVATLYLMEYDILILMARKFYNLFCVFHEENCRKYKRLGIPYQNSGKIVTHRALPLIRNDIISQKYKKVVVADDIIIHGRSIKQVYNELISMCSEVDVLLMSYARNDKDTRIYKDILSKIDSRYLIDECERRALSNEIVNTFYIAGRPYISYLPYFTLNLRWDDLKRRLSDEDCLSIQDSDMKKYGIEAYLYIGKELDIFRGIRCCKKCVVRLYYYSQLDQILMIPYFLIDIMEEKFLEKISDYVRKHFLEPEYQKLLERNSPATEMRSMELEYILSVWAGMYFMNRVLCSEYTWHKEIEKYNFCVEILPEIRLSARKIEEYAKGFRQVADDIFGEEVKKSDNNSEVQTLLRKYNDIKIKYTTNYDRWKKMTAWDKGQSDYEMRFISNYLAENGELDEERCKVNSGNNNRLFGVPVSFILDDMSVYLFELFGPKEKQGYYSDRVFAALIGTADSGRGTIVIKTEKTDNRHEYTESVIYAGEQNYKFYENTNFPVMYGLYLIERQSTLEEVPDKIAKRKQKMVEKFIEYLESEEIFYIKEEVLQIAGFNLSNLYKNFLQDSYEKYSGNKVLNMAVTMALDICNDTEQ